MLLLVDHYDVIPLLHTLALICKPAAETIRALFRDEMKLARPCGRLPHPQTLTWLSMTAACQQLKYETSHLIHRALSDSVVVVKLVQVSNALDEFMLATGEEQCDYDDPEWDEEWNEQAVVAAAADSLDAFCCGPWVAAIAPTDICIPAVPWEMDSEINDMIEDCDEFIANDKEMIEFMLDVILQMRAEFSERHEYLVENPPKRCKFCHCDECCGYTSV